MTETEIEWTVAEPDAIPTLRPPKGPLVIEPKETAHPTLAKFEGAQVFGLADDDLQELLAASRLPDLVRHAVRRELARRLRGPSPSKRHRLIHSIPPRRW